MPVTDQIPDTEQLTVATVAAALEALGGQAHRFDVDVLRSCDSTNTQLLARAEAGAASGTVIVSEQQTAGRGRRGRGWQSGPGDSLTFSLLWRFPAQTSLMGLSLAVGVALARVLEELNIPDVRLKWPNDVLLQGRKLAGILVELVSPPRHGSRGTAGMAAVIGIGINLRLPADLPADIRAGAAALYAVDGASAVPSHQLLAQLLVALREQLEQFARTGFASARAAWQHYHAYANQPVRLLGDGRAELHGICRGVDADGALLLDVGHELGAAQQAVWGKPDHDNLLRIVSGEVSLRLQV